MEEFHQPPNPYRRSPHYNAALERELSYQDREAEHGLGEVSSLYFNIQGHDGIKRRIADKSASRKLEETDAELTEFVAHAKRNGYIKKEEDLEELPVQERIKLCVGFFITHNPKWWSPIGDSLDEDLPPKPKPRIAVFMPTVKARSEMQDLIPEYIRNQADFEFFADSNDIDRQNRDRMSFDYVFDTGVKVFTSVNPNDGVTESKFGSMSKDDLQRRKDSGIEYVGLYGFNVNSLSEKYRNVPDIDYVRDLSEYELSILRNNTDKKFGSLKNEGAYRKTAVQKLRIMGALDENGVSNERGRKMIKIAEYLSLDLNGARLVEESVQNGIPANGVLLSGYIPPIKSEHRIPRSNKGSGGSFEEYDSLLEKHADKWNKFIKRDNVLGWLNKLVDPAQSSLDKRLYLQRNIGDLRIEEAEALIRMLDGVYKLNGRNMELARDQAEIKKDVRELEKRAVIAGYATNVMGVKVEYTPMLQKADARIVISGKDEPVCSDSIPLNQEQSRATALPYLVVSLNNRRVYQDVKRKGDIFDNDPVVNAMNGYPSSNPVSIVGPFLALEPKLLEEISPEAWKQTENWYKKEVMERENDMKKNSPHTAAGEENLQSLKDFFKRT